MPRRARVISITGIYHVIMRGINKQVIFEERKDYLKYLDILMYYKVLFHFKIYAYCLMSNHIHLLIDTNGVELDKIFIAVNTSYALWFNAKYQRSGHLFQDRFFSEPVESERYFLAAWRYILQNPLHAGLESEVGESYIWTSYRDLNHSNAGVPLTETLLPFGVELMRDNLKEFVSRTVEEKVADEDNLYKRITDNKAKSIILEESGCSDASEFQNLPLKDRNLLIGRICAKGVSTRQLSRITGISRGVIDKVRAQYKKMGGE